MACGTGKTLVGYEVAQGLKAKRLLTLVPSLLLVNQMIREYRARGAKHILAVCSDETSGDEDSIQISVKELEADNTTDAKVARAFLSGPDQRIVVCTYQSLRSLSEVFEGLAFDLAIFDEAHKTAGRKSKLFAHGLTDESVKCARRLFMTATPRHATLKEDGSEAQVYAMNNPQVYGPVLYSLPLRNAIEAGIIDDYRIIVAIVSQRGTEDLREQAIRVAIDRAMKVYGIRKVFTFHARVADASNFVLGATDTLKGARLYHVNGMQSSAERGIKLEGFRNADAALMSNARCLTEGVDLPAADMVAFLSPKKNPIDIVQAVGRVLRKHHSKAKGGYVFLPVFVRDGTDEEAAIAESDWSGCYEVLQALREQDKPLSVVLSKCARGDGELPEKIEVMDARKRGNEAEPDRIELSEGMRRSIRVKTVKPFREDSEGCKMELLALARGGSPKPIVHKTTLGSRLHSYTHRSSGCYDAVFDATIRALAPLWFVDTAAENKSKLLDLACSGAPRPNSHNGAIGARLTQYTIKTAKVYDPVFDAEIRTIAPLWFDVRARRVAENKKKLLAMARDGSPKPVRRRGQMNTLAACFAEYITEGRRSYDPEFSAKIREAAPHWLINQFQRAADLDSQLVDLAEAGAPRPKRITAVGRRLTCISSGPLYKADLSARLRALAPHWYQGMGGPGKPHERIDTDAVKKKLLTLARSGADRPHRKTRIAKLLTRFIGRNNPGHDPSFSARIKALAPSWFTSVTSVQTKEALLALAKTGVPKPQRATRLGYSLRRYTSRRRGDPEFIGVLRTLAPHWLECREDTVREVKEKLLALAQDGLPRPPKRGGILGQRLARYTNRKEKQFDESFTMTVSRLAPHWFRK